MDSVLVFAILAMLYYITGLNNITAQLLSVLCTVLQSIPPVTLVPRFVLGLRELCAHDLQYGRGNNIDTAFGFGSERSVGTIMFADAEYKDEGNEIQIKEDVDDISVSRASSHM